MASTSPAPRRRDPEGRRRAILAAASELIVENGAGALTHRAVAARAGVSLGSTTQYFSSIEELRASALQLLSDEIDAELGRIEQVIDGAEALESTARIAHEFLRDRRQVNSELALLHAATVDPTRRALALRWFDRLVELIAVRYGHERATAIAVYIDGATVHAALHDEPLSEASLARAIRALLTIPDRPGSPSTPAQPNAAVRAP